MLFNGRFVKLGSDGTKLALKLTILSLQLMKWAVKPSTPLTNLAFKLTYFFNIAPHSKTVVDCICFLTHMQIHMENQ